MSTRMSVIGIGLVVLVLGSLATYGHESFSAPFHRSENEMPDEIAGISRGIRLRTSENDFSPFSQGWSDNSFL